MPKTSTDPRVWPESIKFVAQDAQNFSMAESHDHGHGHGWFIKYQSVISSIQTVKSISHIKIVDSEIHVCD